MALRQGLVRGPVAGITVIVMVLTACGASSAASPEKSTRPSVSPSDAPVSPLVGRWMQVYTCDQLVSALEAEGLGVMAPGVVGNYFPNEDVDQLAEKPDLCSGAKPQRHSHFFDAVGMFGSLDQHGQQVDDGRYELVDGDTFRIGDATFDFTVDGNQLTLHPLITDAQREQALAHPLEFSTAAWMVAVAYPGTTWKRVPCDGWC